MKPTQEQIDLLDRLFLIVIRHNNGLKPGPELIRKELEIPRDLFQLIYNTMCEIGHQEKVLVAHQFDYGDWTIVRIDPIRSKLFTDQGGFKVYFNNLDKFSGTLGNTYNLINSGNVDNLIQSVGDSSCIIDNPQNITKISKPKSVFVKCLKIVGLVLGVIASLIAIYLFLIKNLIFK